MPGRLTAAKAAGYFLFVAGMIVLALAITGLIPRDTAMTFDSDLMVNMVVNLGMLIVATFMVSTGMFFIIFGGGEAKERKLRGADEKGLEQKPPR